MYFGSISDPFGPIGEAKESENVYFGSISDPFGPIGEAKLSYVHYIIRQGKAE